jgi:hypothetical protein
MTMNRSAALALKQKLEKAFPRYNIWLEDEAKTTPASMIIKTVRELIEDPESQWIHNHETLLLPDWDEGIIFIWSLNRNCLIAISKVS